MRSYLIRLVILCSEDWSTAMITQALGLHETTIVRHADDYVNKEKLKPANGGSGQKTKNNAIKNILLF
ncbi:MAG: hypothetical protein ACI9VT_002672 [Psychroserpens sp.]|jgi:hypothetical protein